MTKLRFLIFLQLLFSSSEGIWANIQFSFDDNSRNKLVDSYFRKMIASYWDIQDSINIKDMDLTNQVNELFSKLQSNNILSTSLQNYRYEGKAGLDGIRSYIDDLIKFKSLCADMHRSYSQKNNCEEFVNRISMAQNKLDLIKQGDSTKIDVLDWTDKENKKKTTSIFSTCEMKLTISCKDTKVKDSPSCYNTSFEDKHSRDFVAYITEFSLGTKNLRFKEPEGDKSEKIMYSIELTKNKLENVQEYDYFTNEETFNKKINILNKVLSSKSSFNVEHNITIEEFKNIEKLKCVYLAYRLTTDSDRFFFQCNFGGWRKNEMGLKIFGPSCEDAFNEYGVVKTKNII